MSRDIQYWRHNVSALPLRLTMLIQCCKLEVDLANAKDEIALKRKNRTAGTRSELAEVKKQLKALLSRNDEIKQELMIKDKEERELEEKVKQADTEAEFLKDTINQLAQE